MTSVRSSRMSIPASVSFLASAGSSIPSAVPDVGASGISIPSASSSVRRAVILGGASRMSGIDARTSSRSTMISIIDDGLSGSDAGSSVTASSPNLRASILDVRDAPPKITAGRTKMTACLPEITAAVTKILVAVTQIRTGLPHRPSRTTFIPPRPHGLRQHRLERGFDRPLLVARLRRRGERLALAHAFSGRKQRRRRRESTVPVRAQRSTGTANDRRMPFGTETEVEAPGIEPGSENGSLTRLRTYPAFCIAPGRACRRALPGASHLFDLASRPVTRRSAIQLVYALRRVLEDPSVGRRSVLFRQRARVRCRSQSYVPRVFTWACGPRYAAMSPSSSSKPIAPFRVQDLKIGML